MLQEGAGIVWKVAVSLPCSGTTAGTGPGSPIFNWGWVDYFSRPSKYRVRCGSHLLQTSTRDMKRVFSFYRLSSGCPLRANSVKLMRFSNSETSGKSRTFDTLRGTTSVRSQSAWLGFNALTSSPSSDSHTAHSKGFNLIVVHHERKSLYKVGNTICCAADLQYVDWFLDSPGVRPCDAFLKNVPGDFSVF